MASTDINIIVKMTDEFTSKFSKIETQLAQVSKGLNDTGRAFTRTGREITQLGTRMAFLGAAMSGPLILAFKNASEYSYEVYMVTRQFDNSLKNLQITIAKDLVPVMTKIVNVVTEVTDWFRNLDDTTRKQILTWTLITGLLLTFGGTIVALIGQIVTFIGIIYKLTSAALALGAPFILIGGAIVILITAFGQWENAISLVLNSIQLLVAALATAIYHIKAMWSAFHGDVKGTIDNFNNAKKSAQEIADIMSGKNGSWATGAKAGINETKKLRSELDKLFSQLQNMKLSGNTNLETDTFLGGFKTGMQKVYDQLKDFGQMGQRVAQQTADAMTKSFSTFFFDVFTRQCKSAKEYFADFGRSVLQIISQMIAQMLVAQMMGNVMGMFGMFTGGSALKAPTGLRHNGGVIRAHNGLSSTDEVPITALSGEGVLSRRGMRALGNDGFNKLNRGERPGGGAVTITINQIVSAWDGRDVIRNKKILAQGLVEELRANAEFRRAIVEYR